LFEFHPLAKFVLRYSDYVIFLTELYNKANLHTQMNRDNRRCGTFADNRDASLTKAQHCWRTHGFV